MKIVLIIVGISLACFAMLFSILVAYKTGKIVQRDEITPAEYNAVDWNKVQNQDPQLKAEVDVISDKAKADVGALTSSGDQMKAECDAIVRKSGRDMAVARMRWLMAHRAGGASADKPAHDDNAVEPDPQAQAAETHLQQSPLTYWQQMTSAEKFGTIIPFVVIGVPVIVAISLLFRLAIIKFVNKYIRKRSWNAATRKWV